MRVAIPVQDSNLTIVTRTGHAPYFAIFNINQKEYTLEQLAENQHAKHHHHGHGHGHHHHHSKGKDEEDIQQHIRELGELASCDILLFKALGPHFKIALDRVGVKTYKINNKIASAPEALQEFIEQLKE